MNRFINSFLLFLLFPTMLLSIYVGLDLPITFIKNSGQFLPYKEEIFLGIGLVVLVINLRRSIRRWMGVGIVAKQEKFKWNYPVSKSRKKRVNTYLMLEAFVFLFAGIALYTVCNDAWMPGIGFGFVAIDNLVFTIFGKAKDIFRIGLSSKALIIADRDVVVIYFNGLRKISVQQDSIFFDYKEGVQLNFPSDCIPEGKFDDFFDTLEGFINKDRVYISRIK